MNKLFKGNIRLCLIIAACVTVIAVILTLAGVGCRTAASIGEGTLLHFSVGEAFDNDKVSRALSDAGVCAAIVRTQPAALPAGEAEETEEAAKDEGDGRTDFEILLDRVLTDDEVTAAAEKVTGALAADYSGIRFVFGGKTTANVTLCQITGNALKGIAVLFVLACVYALVRYDVLHMFSCAVTILLSLVASFSLAAIVSLIVPMSASVEASALFAACSAAAFTMLVFDRKKDLARTQEYARKTRVELADGAVTAAAKVILPLLLAGAVAFICMCFSGVSSVISASAFALCGMIASAFVCTTFAGAFWAAAADRKSAGKKA